MNSDLDDSDVERLFNRTERAGPPGAELLADLLQAAATPDPSRALVGEDAAITAFRAARAARRTPRASHRRLALSTALMASLIALLATVAGATATRTATPSREQTPSLSRVTTSPTSPAPIGQHSSTPLPLDNSATVRPQSPNATGVSSRPTPDRSDASSFPTPAAPPAKAKGPTDRKGCEHRPRAANRPHIADHAGCT